MERATIKDARNIFGNNFIGIEELKPFFFKLGIKDTGNILVPEINYSTEELHKYSQGYILILGLSKISNTELSIRTLRNVFDVNPDISQPCFYNQDWYLKEDFINETLKNRWYLIKKEVLEESRSVQPAELLKQNFSFPSAVLCTYTFFANYYANNELLWYHDFVWCSDVDHNGDRIYVGKYHDIDGVNRNGFSIHRHLGLRSCYGAITLL